MPTSDLAVVPDGLGLVEASTVPLNGLAGAQIVDLLEDVADISAAVRYLARAVNTIGGSGARAHN